MPRPRSSVAALACLFALVAAAPVVATVGAAVGPSPGVAPSGSSLGIAADSIDRSAPAVGATGAASTAGAGPVAAGASPATGTDATSTAGLGHGSITVVNVTVEPSPPFAGQPARFELRVRNDGSVPLRLKRATVRPFEETDPSNPRPPYAEEKRPVPATLAPGETATLELAQESGDGPLTGDRLLESTDETLLRAVVEAETRDPTLRQNETVTTERRFEVDPRSPPEPELSVRGADFVAQEGNELVVEVSNFGDVPLRRLEVRFVADVESFPIEMDADDVTVNRSEYQIPELPPEESRTFRFNVSASRAAENLRLGAQVKYKYDLFGDRRAEGGFSKTAPFDFAEPERNDTAPAELVLSQPNVEYEDSDRVRITGSLGNRGELPASGINLSVVGEQGIRPAQPAPTYFVEGGLPVDESKDFELFARVGPNVSRVSVRVTYRSDGRQFTEVVEVAVPERESTTDAAAQGDGGSTLVVAVVVLAVLLVAGYAVVRSRGGDDGAPVTPGDGGEGPGTGEDPSLAGGETDAAGELAPGGPDSARGGSAPGVPPRSDADAAGSGPRPGSGHDAGDSPAGHGHGPSDSHSRAHGPGDTQHGHGHGDTQHGHGHGRGQGRGEGDAAAAGSETGAGAGGGSGREVRCDGCGRPYHPDQLGTIALSEGETAHTCQDCQADALAAAKDELGADQGETGGVDELVTAMSEQPPCDGCGRTVPEEELVEMTLPDGTTALSCADCRDDALAAAREAIADGDGDIDARG